MKRLSILMLAMLSFCCRKENISLDMQVEFNKFYGGSGPDWARSIIPGSDGGYVFAGYTSSNDGDVTGNHGQQDAWIVKLKIDGTIQWQKAFGGSGDRETANSIISSGDGGYVFVGKYSSNDGGCDLGKTGAWIVKLDKDGNILWQKIIPGRPSGEGISIAATSDGYVVLMLEEAYLDSPSVVVKIDKNGKILWQLPLAREILRIGSDIISSSDGQVIVVGEDLANSGRVGGIAKLDKDGNVLWHRILDTLPFYGGYRNGYSPMSVVNNGDGGYFIAGIVNLVGYNDGWIVKVDKDGFTQWQKTYGTTDNDQLRCIIKSKDGGYIVAGNTLSTDNNGDVNDDGWLFKIDESGNMLWQNRYGGGSGDSFESLIETQEGEYVMAGTSQSNSSASIVDAWVVKVRK